MATKTFTVDLVPHVQAILAALDKVAAHNDSQVNMTFKADGELLNASTGFVYGTRLVMQPNGSLMVQLPPAPAPVRPGHAQHLVDEMALAIEVARSLNTTGLLPALFTTPV